MDTQPLSHPTDSLPAEEVRRQLFFTWCGLFILYGVTFMSTSIKRGVGFPLAIDATWKVAYLIVPVLGAFAGYWFGLGQQPTEADEVVDRQRRQIMFVLTGVLHGMVYLIIVFGILLEDFRDQEFPVPYPQRVDLVLKFMLLIWSVSLLPVGWLLKGQKIAVPPDLGEDKAH
jgi:hypothetical protein